jgi:hydroxymethylglutaryl-CoA lyase
VCSEEIVHALALMGYDTGVDLARLMEAAQPPASADRPRHAQPDRQGRPRLDLHPVPDDFDIIRERALARAP